MAQDFKKGDKVRPKSGGPVRVVEAVYDPVFFYRYFCAWTDKDGKRQSELFKAEEVVAAPDDAPAN